MEKLHGLSRQDVAHICWAFIRADIPCSDASHAILTAIIERARAEDWLSLDPSKGRALSRIEARCAEIVSSLAPDSLSNRQLVGLELAIAVKSASGILNLEVEETMDRSVAQQHRRDAFLSRLGVRVVRVHPYDTDKLERMDLEQELARALHRGGVTVAEARSRVGYLPGQPVLGRRGAA